MINLQIDIQMFSEFIPEVFLTLFILLPSKISPLFTQVQPRKVGKLLIWAPLHKTFCQTFFAIKNSGKISMQIAMEIFFLPEFPDFCRKNIRQKVLCNGTLGCPQGTPRSCSLFRCRSHDLNSSKMSCNSNLSLNICFVAFL